MAIKTLGHRKVAAHAVFPNIGSLHKGTPKAENGQMGAELEYWRFSSGDAAVVAAFEAAFGKQPKAVHAYFPDGDLARVWDPWCEQWGTGGRLQHRCDGEICVQWREGDKLVSDWEQAQHHPCPGKCSWVGRLSLIIPELWEAGHVGLVKLVLTSKYDIAHVTDVLTDVWERNQAAGGDGLAGVQFTLTREWRLISAPDAKGGSRRVKKCLVRVYPGVEWQRALLRKARAKTLGEPETVEVLDSETGEVLASAAHSDLDVADVDRTEVELFDERDGVAEPSAAASAPMPAPPPPQAPAPAPEPNDGYDHWLRDETKRKLWLVELKRKGLPDKGYADVIFKTFGIQRWAELDELRLPIAEATGMVVAYMASLSDDQPPPFDDIPKG